MQPKKHAHKETLRINLNIIEILFFSRKKHSYEKPVNTGTDPSLFLDWPNSIPYIVSSNAVLRVDRKRLPERRSPMLEERVVFVNSRFIPWKEAKVHMMSHSFGRGSAIFEVMSLHETEAGPAVFRLDEHIRRLFRTAQLLDMEIPLTPQAFQQAVMETVKENGVREGFIKIICFYPQIAFEILPPQKALDAAIFVVDPVQDLGGLRFPFETGASACISKWRKLDPETVPVEAKAAANYLNGMLARAEARERGFDQVIMLDTQGFIAEGGTESVFLIKDGRLMTPGLGTVLISISRKTVLEIAPVVGVETFEGRLPPKRLYEADEIFFSGTPMKVLPVNQIEDRALDEAPGPLTRKLGNLVNEIVSGRDQRFRSWLFPVR
jgi:branched-chain amino acid aminotransferase